ncbi:SEC-C domain-containing protein [bacterium]|nr:SEC-C domain-containing protein [bacterium]
MAIRRTANFVKRNDRCPCGSGRKFKSCCSPDAPNTRPNVHVHRPAFADTGERPIRWVITDGTMTKFFADKDNRAMVFQNQAEAIAIASLEEFRDQDPGEINIAGVGETKWQLFQEKIAFVEIDDIEQAVQLVRERIEMGRAGELTESKPLDLSDEKENTQPGSQSVDSDSQDQAQSIE